MSEEDRRFWNPLRGWLYPGIVTVIFVVSSWFAQTIIDKDEDTWSAIESVAPYTISICLLISLLLIVDYLVYRRINSRWISFKPILSMRSFEVDLSWGDRHKAIEEIKKDILNSESGVFASGIALRTISQILNDDEVVSKIKDRVINGSKSFCVELIACDRGSKARRSGDDIDSLDGNIEEGMGMLLNFKRKLEQVFSEIEKKKSKNYLKVTTYPKGMIPRHALIKTDNSIYVGSYLHHVEGKDSYMIRLCNKRDVPEKYKGLYKLFDQEIRYLKLRCTSPYKFEIVKNGTN